MTDIYIFVVDFVFLNDTTSLIMKQDREAIKTLMINKVLELCEQCLHYNADLQIEGLLGLTFDHTDVVLVNINKMLSNALQHQQSQVIDLSTRSAGKNNVEYHQSSVGPHRSNRKQYKSSLTSTQDICLPSSSVQVRSSPHHLNTTSIITISNDDDDYTNEFESSDIDKLFLPVDPLFGPSDVEYSIATGYDHEQPSVDLDDRTAWNSRKRCKRRKPQMMAYPHLGALKIEQHIQDNHFRRDTMHEEQYDVYHKTQLDTNHRERVTEVKDEPIDMLHVGRVSTFMPYFTFLVTLIICMMLFYRSKQMTLIV